MPRRPDTVSDATLKVLIAPGLGPITWKKLRARFGSDDQILGASVEAMMRIDGIKRDTAESLRRSLDEADPAGERAAMLEHGACLITIEDDDYPPLLKTIDDPPTALWLKGDVKESDRLAVAIVGSRRCTAYGREQAGRFSSLLAQSGLTVVSGGAAGVDSEAHRGALRVNGRTIAVMGCGLSHTYPPEHADLFARIADGRGAILSELPMNSPPRATNFPRRNRIISGLSVGVLVVEAAVRSGALITARLAAEEHHRQVMAIPGRIDSPASAGCLRAIREGWAALVMNHADVLMELDGANHQIRGAVEVRGSTSTQASLFDGTFNDAQQAIIGALKAHGAIMEVDQLSAHTQLPISRIMAELTLLQIRNVVVREGGGVRMARGT